MLKSHVFSSALDYGPITHKNDSNKNEFLTAMKTLPVTRGGDCPELAFTGMLEAYKANPLSGSPMFVFTDASARDDTPQNMAKLKSEAAQHSSAITFFTNRVGCGKGKKYLINFDVQFISYSFKTPRNTNYSKTFNNDNMILQQNYNLTTKTT